MIDGQMGTYGGGGYVGVLPLNNFTVSFLMEVSIIYIRTRKTLGSSKSNKSFVF